MRRDRILQGNPAAKGQADRGEMLDNHSMLSLREDSFSMKSVCGFFASFIAANKDYV
jgi:hypothetical protein